MLNWQSSGTPLWLHAGRVQAEISTETLSGKAGIELRTGVPSDISVEVEYARGGD